MNAFAIRITYPYEVVARVISRWSTYCKRIACYEHNDDGAERVHCHIYVEGVKVDKKRLQQLAAEAVAVTVPNQDKSKRAHSLMSFRQKEYDYNIAGYSYLTKGKYDASYLQGFTKEQADEWKAAWVDPAQHITRTPARIMYEEFLSWWHDKANRLPLGMEDTPELVVSRAHAFLRSYHHGVLPYNWRMVKGNLIQNYCDNYRVKYPNNWKEW